MKRCFLTIEKPKLRRLVEDVASINSTFRNFIKNLPSETLNITEYTEFRDRFRRVCTPNKSRKNLSKIDGDAQSLYEIKAGTPILTKVSRCSIESSKSMSIPNLEIQPNTY